jgi:WD40 repeat protein
MNPRQFRVLILISYVLSSLFIGLQSLPQDHTNAIMDTVYSPDGRFIATVSLDKRLVIWDAAQCQATTTIELETVVSYLVYSPDGNFLASGDANGVIRIWDTHTGELARTLKGQLGVITSLDYSPDGKMLISTSYGSDKVFVWDMETGGIIRRLDMLIDIDRVFRLKGAVFSPNGQFIAAANGELVYLWNANTGARLNQLENNSHRPHKLNYSPNGQALISSGDGTTPVVLWDAATGQELQSLSDVSNFRRVEAYSPDGNTILSRYSHWLELWDAQTLEQVSNLGENRRYQVTSAAYSPNGRYIVSSNMDSGATIWDANTLEAACHLES